MNCKCIEGRTGWWRVKASSPDGLARTVSLVFLLRCFCPQTFAQHTQQSGDQRPRVLITRHWNARGLLRCVSWHCSKGGNEDQAEKKP